MKETETIIGPSVMLEGTIQGDEDFMIHGRVEGSINTKRDVTISESGLVKAEIKAKNVLLHGVLAGDLFSGEKVEIGEKGRMIGNITTLSLVIRKGASFKGRIEMPDFFEEKKVAGADRGVVPATSVEREKKEAVSPPGEKASPFPEPPPVTPGRKKIIIKKK